MWTLLRRAVFQPVPFGLGWIRSSNLHPLVRPVPLYSTMVAAAEGASSLIPSTSSVATYNSILVKLAKGGRYEDLVHVSQKMKEAGLQPDLVTYNTLMSAMARAHNLNAAIALFERMKLDGIKPNIVTYNCLITAYLFSNQMDPAWKVLTTMKRAKVLPSTATFNSFLSAALKGGDYKRAEAIVEQMKKEPSAKPNSITVFILVARYAEAGRLLTALDHVKTLCGQFAIVPQSQSLSTLIREFIVQKRNVDVALSLFHQFRHKGPGLSATTTRFYCGACLCRALSGL